MSFRIKAVLALLTAALTVLMCACNGLDFFKKPTDAATTSTDTIASATDAGISELTSLLADARGAAQGFYDNNYNSGFHEDSPEEKFHRYFNVFAMLEDYGRYISAAYEKGTVSPQGGSSVYKWTDERFGDEYFLLFSPGERELSFTFTPVLGECFMIEVKKSGNGWNMQWATLSGGAWEVRELAFTGVEGSLSVTSGLTSMPASIYGVTPPADFAKAGDTVLRAIGGSVGM